VQNVIRRIDRYRQDYYGNTARLPSFALKCIARYKRSSPKMSGGLGQIAPFDRVHTSSY